jgi:alkylhydroperoxidase family enzyme
VDDPRHRASPDPRHLEDHVVFLEQLKTATPQVNGQSDLRHLFAYQPQSMRHLLAFTQAVMRDAGPLSAGECELVAAMTSKDNQCLF